jgi:hypothetical protein
MEPNQANMVDVPILEFVFYKSGMWEETMS